MATNKDNNALTTSKQLPLVTAESLLPIGVSFESLQDNLMELDQIQFPRIRVTDAKFYLTNQEDDEGTTEFEGVIHCFVRQNTYWATGFDSKNTGPPECYSLDGKRGTKYGECRTCQYNQFGSAMGGQGKGKACRNQIKLYVQLEGKAIPLTMLISPINISAFSQNYLVDTLAQRGLNYWKVKTRFSIGKKKGEQFGRIKCELVGEFRGDELEKIKKMRDFWLKVVEGDSKSLDVGTEVKESVSDDTSPPKTVMEARIVTPKTETKPPVVDDGDPPF